MTPRNKQPVDYEAFVAGMRREALRHNRILEVEDALETLAELEKRFAIRISATPKRAARQHRTI